jgi:hypothetical protein
MTTTWLMGANGVGGIPQAIQKRLMASGLIILSGLIKK